MAKEKSPQAIKVPLVEGYQPVQKGHQPTQGKLDVSKPPAGGSGVPPKASDGGGGGGHKE